MKNVVNRNELCGPTGFELSLATDVDLCSIAKNKICLMQASTTNEIFSIIFKIIKDIWPMFTSYLTLECYVCTIINVSLNWKQYFNFKWYFTSITISKHINIIKRLERLVFEKFNEMLWMPVDLFFLSITCRYQKYFCSIRFIAFVKNNA